MAKSTEPTDEPGVADLSADTSPAEETKAPVEPAPVFRVALTDDVNSAQFHVAGVEVELDQDNPYFETSDPRIFAALLEHAFLTEA